MCIQGFSVIAPCSSFSQAKHEGWAPLLSLFPRWLRLTVERYGRGVGIGERKADGHTAALRGNNLGGNMWTVGVLA